VHAIAGLGLEGDRYAVGRGTFSVAGGRGNELTLIAGEVLDALALPDGRPLSGGEARRNVVTRGLDLNALVGRRFRIGELELFGRRRCEPCAHLPPRRARGRELRRLVSPGAIAVAISGDVGDDDARGLAPEREGGGAADAAGRCGDERDLACEAPVLTGDDHAVPLCVVALGHGRKSTLIASRWSIAR
jgi:hypothetical protein